MSTQTQDPIVLHPTVGSAETLFEVQPGEQIDFPVDGFVLGRPGDITIEFVDGRVASFAALPAGVINWFAISRVLRTSAHAVYVVPRA